MPSKLESQLHIALYSPGDQSAVDAFKDACPRRGISTVILALMRYWLSLTPAERAALLEARDA